MVSITEIIGFSGCLYLINYSLYRIYFPRPLLRSSLSQIIAKNIKARIWNRIPLYWNEQVYYVKLTYGINFKPIAVQDVIQQPIMNNYTLMMMKNINGQYSCITPLNMQFQIDLYDGLATLLRIRNRSNYVLINIQHKTDENHNYLTLQAIPQAYNKQEIQYVSLDECQHYYYVICKYRDYSSIHQQLGNTPMDLDYYNKIINFTIKSDITQPHIPIKLQEQWLMDNQQYIKAIIEINNQYEIKNITQIGHWKISNTKKSSQIYNQVITNLNTRVIDLL